MPLQPTLDAPAPADPIEEQPRSPRRWGIERLRSLLKLQTLTLGTVAFVLAYLSLTPLVYLAYGTFFEEGAFTLDAFTRAYADDGLPDMVWNSFVFTVGSTILSMVAGTFLAYVTVRTNVPFRPLLVATAIVPLIIPGLLYTIAWVLLSSENVGLLNQISTAIVGEPIFDVFTMTGMVWAQGTHGAPLVYLFMVAAFRSMDPSLEESALVCGASKLTMLRRVSLPLVRPALAAAFLITAVDGLTSFEVPVLLGVPNRIYVFVSTIYDSLRDFPYDYGAAGALSIGLVVIAILGVYFTNKLRGDTKEFATVTGKGFRPQTLDLGRSRWPIGIVIAGYFLITTILPLLVLLYTSFLPYYQTLSMSGLRSLSLANYRTLFADPVFQISITNSFALSMGSATIIVLMTGIAGWLVVRTKIPGRQVVEQLAFLPLVVPGLVMGVAISFVYLRNPLPIPIYGTMLILYIAYVTRFMPYGMNYAVASLVQISPELEESGQVSGATWWQTMRRIVLPLMIPGLVAAWIYIVIVSIRELSSSILLYTPGNETLSIAIFQMYDRGEMTVVSALSIVMVGTLLVFVGIAYKVGSRIGLKQ